MELENNLCLPFLDVLIKKKVPNGFSHTVYRKKTHTNRYLNANSSHHPRQLNSIIDTLINRSIKLTDIEHRSAELETTTNILLMNGYSQYNIEKSIYKHLNPPANEKPKFDNNQPKAFLPYIKGVTDKISKVLRKDNIHTVFTTNQKISNLIRSAKDKVPNENQGVYEVPCSNCHKKYYGETNRRVEHRLYEHKIALRNLDSNSSLTQHFLNSGHTFNFEKAKTIAPITNQKSRIIREAIEIFKDDQNLNNRNDSLRVSNLWKPLLNNLKKSEQIPNINITQNSANNNIQITIASTSNNIAPTNRYNLRPRKNNANSDQ